MYICTYVYVYVYICTRIYVNMSIPYIYIHTHRYIYIYALLVGLLFNLFETLEGTRGLGWSHFSEHVARRYRCKKCVGSLRSRFQGFRAAGFLGFRVLGFRKVMGVTSQDYTAWQHSAELLCGYLLGSLSHSRQHPIQPEMDRAILKVMPSDPWCSWHQDSLTR